MRFSTVCIACHSSGVTVLVACAAIACVLPEETTSGLALAMSVEVGGWLDCEGEGEGEGEGL